MKKNNLIRLLWAGLFLCHTTWAFGKVIPTVDEPVVMIDDVVMTKDSFEKFNRGVFYVNDHLDKVLLKPIAKGYVMVVPKFGRRCVHGIFGNLDEPYTAINNVLQGKLKAAGQDTGRFVVNTVAGLGGCFDVAAKMGLLKHDEDFGQTLGRWGVPSGSFVMVPFLGPSTVRDLIAKPIDYFSNPAGYLTLLKLRNGLAAARLVDSRASLLGVTEGFEDQAIDRYALMRDTWLQFREAKVRDEDYEPEEAPLASTSVTSTETLEIQPLTLQPQLEYEVDHGAAEPVVQENIVLGTNLPVSVSTQMLAPY